ncbi:MAG: bifunctional 3,4-dihydroxy-2-butanone-4-phosphate synthase/GTP cyclohydrolase II [Actinomycetota bacterium]
MDSLNKKYFSKIEEAMPDIKQGKIMIIVDDRSEKNEGVFYQAAEKATPGSINFMMTHGKSLICLPCGRERLDELKIPMMVTENEKPPNMAAFVVSIDVKNKSGTGVSAKDRAATIKSFIDPKTKPGDFAMPGHIFPLRANPGGVLVRAGHTESAVDLSRICGLYPAGVICEVINEEGEVALLNDLVEIASKFSLKILTIEELIRYRKRKEKLIEKVSEAILPTKWGKFKAVTYRSKIDNETHIALVKGEVRDRKNVLVRVHSQCLTGDTFGSQRCDCGQQLNSALEMINKKGEGVLLYMAQEGRGIGLCNKMKAYELQDQGLDTVEANLKLGFDADLRDYGLGAQILSDLGLTSLHLMTNNPRKVVGLEGYGLKITERLPLKVRPNSSNRRYLDAKKMKLNHLLD